MFFLRLISRLPLRILYLISDFLFIGGYYVVKYRRAIVWQNISRSFPEKTETERRVIEKQFYRNLCDYPMETLKMLTMPEAEFDKRLTFVNGALLTKLAAEGRSVFCMTSHQFNWEWLIAGVSRMQTHPMYYIYQSQSSDFFDRFSNEIRARFGARGIKREQVGRETIKLRGTLHGLCTVADQFPGFIQDKKYWTNFLHQDTAFFQGVQQIAAIGNYTVVFFSIQRTERGHYRCTLTQIAQPPYEKEATNVVEEYARATEATIRRQPDGWLWSHNRWKFTRAQLAAAEG